MSLEEVHQELRGLLGTQCTVYPAEDGSVRVWPWVASVCQVYAAKGHVLKKATEVTTETHARHLVLEFLDGESEDTLEKSLQKEVGSICLKV